MNILIVGATGFIGNSIFHSLITQHHITIASRRPIDGYTNWKFIDFTKENDWDFLLDDIELVINTVGIIEGDFDQIQTKSPIKFYSSCIKKNIKIIHISAIGAEKEQPISSFLQTKKVTDNFLLQYDKAKIIYPGIVIGKYGASSQFFTEIAQLPVIPLLSKKPIPLLYINQLLDLVKHIIEDYNSFPKQVFAIAKPEDVKQFFSALKGKKGKFIKVPTIVFKALFSLFPKFSVGIFNKDTFQLLQQISTNDYTPLFNEETSKHIKSTTIVQSDFFPQLFALLAISFIWVWSGFSSLISWDESCDIMNEIGTNHLFTVSLIFFGSVADIALGIALFIKPYRKQVIILQVIVMLTYMLILTVFVPQYWLHPFGVLSKNIPLLALSYYLYQKQVVNK